MEIGTVFGTTLVRVKARDAREVGAGRWWLVGNDGAVWLPLPRDGEGGRAVREGAPHCHAGTGVVMVPSWWLVSRRRGVEAAALRRTVDRVLTLARVPVRAAV